MELMVDFLSNWAVWVLGFFATAFAIRGSVKFDVNQWLNDRRERIKEKIRLACPHAWIVEHEGKFQVESAFISPAGTHQYQCQRCGVVVHDPHIFHLNLIALAKDPKAWDAVEKKVERLAKKL